MLTYLLCEVPNYLTRTGEADVFQHYALHGTYFFMTRDHLTPYNVKSHSRKGIDVLLDVQS